MTPTAAARRIANYFQHPESAVRTQELLDEFYPAQTRVCEATVWITPDAAKMEKSNMKGKTMKKTMKFSVIFRNGKALRGFAKHGTALACCDPIAPDEVIDGTFSWTPKAAKKSAPKRRKGVTRGK